MTDMDDLVTWLGAQLDARSRELDEDERVALDASVGPWHASRSDGSVYAAESSVVNMPGPLPDWATYIVRPDSEGGEGIEPADARHIARWDPARVLREVEIGRAEVDATRRILGDHPSDDVPDRPHCVRCGDWPMVPWPCTTVRVLALPYADHRGYQEEWRPYDHA
jgi:hypothetical protein